MHKVGEGVTERHVALAKKYWKKWKIGGAEGKLLENCGKKGEKKRREEGKRVKRRKIGEKKEKRERIGGERWKGENKREGKVGKPRGPKACYMMSQTSLEFCLPCPVHLCTKSDHVRSASEKTQKMWEKSQKMHI